MRNLTGQVLQLDGDALALGGKADIYLGLWAGKMVAIKDIRAHATRDPSDLRKLKRRVIKEGILWSPLCHPNVVPFLGVCNNPLRPDLPRLIFPYYHNGNLCSYLRNNPDVDKLNLICQIAAGLSYLHSPKIHMVHGNIRASNILVSDAGQALLANFGLARLLEHSDLTSNAGGTYRWMAPELFEFSDDKESPRLTAATDTWAFTMTVLEMFTGRMPFCHIPRDRLVVFALRKGELPCRDMCLEVSPEVWAILHRCWTSERPSHRPSMHALSFTFNVLSALRRENGSVPGVSLLAILDALERKEDELHVLQLRRTEHECDVRDITNALLLAGKCHEESSKCDRDCRVGDRIQRRRWTISDKQETSGRDDESLPSRRLVDLPYWCHWPSCKDRFNSLVKCQDHESRHVMQGIEIRAFDA